MRLEPELGLDARALDHAGEASGADAASLEFSCIFDLFADERSRFRPLMLWRTCGGRFRKRMSGAVDTSAPRRLYSRDARGYQQLAAEHQTIQIGAVKCLLSRAQS